MTVLAGPTLALYWVLMACMAALVCLRLLVLLAAMRGRLVWR